MGYGNWQVDVVQIYYSKNFKSMINKWGIVVKQDQKNINKLIGQIYLVFFF